MGKQIKPNSRNKTRIKLLTFFRTGNFGGIKGGVTTDWLNDSFVRATDKTFMRGGAAIWRYGVIEFHFFNGELFLIWCDNLDYIQSNRWIIFDKWILTHPERLTLDYVQRHLQQEKIAFSIEHKRSSDDLDEVQLVLASQVQLYFEDGLLVAFGKHFD